MRKKIRALVHHYTYAIGLVWQSSRLMTTVRLIVILLQAAFPLVSLYCLKLVIDRLTSSSLADVQFQQDILPLLILLGVTFLLQGLAKSISQFINVLQQQKVSDYVANLLQSKSLSIDLAFYDDPSSHDTYTLAQKHGLVRPTQVLRALMDLLQNALSALFIGGFIFYLNPVLILLLLLAVMPSAIIKYVFSEKIYQWEKRRVMKEREAHYFNFLATDASYAKEVRVFNAGKFLYQRFQSLRSVLYKERKSINTLKIRINTIAHLLEVTAEVTCYGIIVYRTLNGLITIGDLVIYFQGFQKAKANLAAMLQAVVGLQENRMFLTHLMRFLNLKEEIVDTPDSKPFKEMLNEGLEMHNVSFRYPKSSSNAISNISLSFPKGKMTALVGDNGSGKSTVVKLIARLYDPFSGKITMDGKEYKTILVSDLRSKMSITFQDFAHFFLRVSENIRLSEMDAQRSNEELLPHASKSGADLFISKLPNGYEQQLGKPFKQGMELSQGQWQKIALARMFFKDAEVYIVDEPTSAIDPLAEHKIFESLKELAKNKVVILITHRLYNLKIADNIIVMENGKVIEEGHHDDLIGLKGKYARMVEKQL